ncbi:RNA-binding domain-containing protein [Suhomyces tanzawaensis NRRL Y-17324]|uniref:RNA-binding domain-containing protein n=1 Tax=Suhomyces tanzawaensis NRRL Y-17324 TaxID=984487 RepID=A0A1E4SI98_9ASCO|nr:RNA-binding domain-containing protein [Suhomyces tanzawaensis NRRL Y-17324]ODV79231.1 RNA-binding domain-containing protein [Suhomyces tanzawaensis NRRL Y-17324]
MTDPKEHQPLVEPQPVDDAAPVQEPEPEQSHSAHADEPRGETTPTPASAIEGGREVSKMILYVGMLHKSVSEDMLKEMFSVGGAIQSVKVLNDKNKPGFNYAFVEFENTQAAEVALHTLNGRLINNAEIKINWAFQSSTINSASRPDEPSFNIFVGDLSPEVDDETLYTAFTKFLSLKQAHVMWDMQTSRSRGYGFVTFGLQTDAELALQTMNGQWINGRAIRCNWASHKQLHHSGSNNFRNNRHHLHHNNARGPFRPYNNNLMPQQQMGAQGGLPSQYAPQLQGGLQPGSGNGPVLQSISPPNGTSPAPSQGGPNQQASQQANIPVMSPQSYDIVLRQTPSWQTTVYLGNIAHYSQQTDLIPLLQNFGFIVDFKFHPERGCAFVKYDSHERAALAIVQLAGFTINGRPLKCGWGKDRPPMGQYQNFGRGPIYQRP